MAEHLIDGEFQSDKYPSTPCGECHLRPGEICDICGLMAAFDRLKAIRDKQTAPFLPGCRVYRHVLVGQDRNFDVTDIQPLTVALAHHTTLMAERARCATIARQWIKGEYR